MTATEPTMAPEPVVPAPNSRLEQLSARYGPAKEAADKADAELKEITDAIKYELISARPGFNSIDLTSDYLERPLRLFASKRNNFDRKKFEGVYPGVYERFTIEATVWQLRAVGGSKG